MLEIEIKCPIKDLAAMRRQLDDLGWTKIKAQDEVDAYFNAPDRDFAQTDEAVRLRRIGPQNILTYKGPKVDSVSKSRKECEVPLQDGAAAASALWDLMTALHYRLTGEVRKHRAFYHPIVPGSFPVELCLDDVVDLGGYVELEIKAPAEARAAAVEYLQNLAQGLGLSHTERRSYLELLQAKKQG